MGAESKITSKGQTTIPIDIREHLDLKDGDKIAYQIEDGAVRLMKKRSAMELIGALHAPDRKPVSVEEMNETVSEAILEENS